MDKPNKTDNAEHPAETADTEGGLTAEKPRSRRKKTSIAHIATVCGSVYTGGKTAKDIKKQAERSHGIVYLLFVKFIHHFFMSLIILRTHSKLLLKSF